MALYTFEDPDGAQHEIQATTPNGGRRVLAKALDLTPSQLTRVYHNPAGVIFTNNLGKGRGTTRKSTFRKPGK